MARYDRAITVFSPDGHLFQVEYAMEAVRKGNAAVGVRGTDAVVLGVEKKSTPKLQDSRSVGKMNKKYTQSGGVRPFGLSLIVVLTRTQVSLTLSNRSMNTFSAWKANRLVVESGGKNIEVAVMTKEHGLRQLEESEIDAIVAEIEAEKAAAEAAKKAPPKET
ncbi:phenylacrylic acid decarboxylase [Datura stramonium]|uniref:Phenylacrylic acid decarboxylase n=1 Tax=Datura stramonium TaxID=4076 RepID=A0ABS8VPG7_DATST|nr:phenylacrylic acid decarboxylase [Datura stramonium]